jgi:homopolymeric O-antigen transport system permease protein
MASKNKAVSSFGENVVRFLNPFSIVVHLWRYRNLIQQLTWREVIGRYKGSFIGLGWAIINPLIMLGIYTFVFSVIFRARWGVELEEGRAAFALTLFIGLITFSLFAEVVNSAPTLILSNVNYVKKVVFPLEIIILVRFLSVTINALFSLSILLVGILFVYGYIPWTALLLPIAWLPIMMFSLGWGYFLASLGVFMRDLGPTVTIITTMLFFLSPIFYPVTAVPERLRVFFWLNPIAIFVEDARRVVVWGLMPDWPFFLGGLALSLLVFILGYIWFMKSKKAFADVI